MSRKSVRKDGMSLMRPLDSKIAIVFLILLAVSIGLYVFLIIDGSFTVFTASPALSIPFLAAGVASYILNRNFIMGVVALAAALISFFLFPDFLFFVLYLLVCTQGVAMMADIFQRKYFYPVLKRVERIDSGKRGIIDRTVAFLFCIPSGLDTRDIMIDTDYSRSKIPMRSIVSSMSVVMLICLFIWMYVFMNPDLSVETEGVPIFTFTIIMYLSLLVIPWTVFDTVNARVGTGHKEFRLYKGFMDNARKAAVPAVIALVIIILAQWTGIENVYFAAMTVAMVAVAVGISSVMHFSVSELPLVSDIAERWEKFHPIGVYSGYSPYGKPSMDDDVPGTPRRNPSDCFSTDIRIRGR